MLKIDNHTSFIPIKLVRFHCHGLQAVVKLKPGIGFSQNPFFNGTRLYNPYFDCIFLAKACFIVLYPQPEGRGNYGFIITHSNKKF